MQKISYGQLKAEFWKFNVEHGYTTKGTDKKLVGVIVFTVDSYTRKYTEIQRSYRVTSDNKAFIPGQLGYSIFAGCLDGSDQGVRLDLYMKDEHGGESGWEVDYCYLLEDEE